MSQLEREPTASRAARGEHSSPGERAGGHRSWWRAHRGLLAGAAVLALLAVPLAIALGVLHSPRWYPLLDLAQAEMRVRDVGSSHPPLVGAAGRIEAFGVRGSHPGPLSWYMLWPIYALAGSTAWGLQLATAVTHLAAAALVLWLAHRRGGVAMIVGFGAALAVLGHVYGPAQLTEAWNPYLPVLWWFTFLVAAWSVLCDDLVALPVLVFAGSVCTQAHISYLGLVGGVTAVVVAVAAVRAWRRRAEPKALRRALGWIAAATVLGLVLWAPPLVEQLSNAPGNASIIADHLGHPSEEPVGVARGLELLAIHLNPWRLLAGEQGTGGAVLPGLAVVGAWAAAAWGAWRMRHTRLVRLHAVVGLTLGLSAVSVSRIFGELWYYLVLWAWGTTALAGVAICWTVAVAAARRWPDHTSTVAARRWDRALLAAPAAVIVIWTVLFAADATSVEVPAPGQSQLVAHLAPDTVRALEQADLPGGGDDGRDGRYLITWRDPVALGAAGQGVMLELERQGFDVRALPVHTVAMREHRITTPDDAMAEIHLAVGADIDRWRERAGAREIAYVDPRSAVERARYDQLRGQLASELGATVSDDLVESIDDHLALLAFDPDLGPAARDMINEMTVIGQPAAVFILPQPPGS